MTTQRSTRTFRTVGILAAGGLVLTGLAAPAFAAVKKPPAPKSVKATVTSSSVSLSWKSGGGSTKGFNVYRSTTSHVKLSKPLNKKLIHKTSYKSSGLSASKSYWFVVQSVNSKGKHRQSAKLKVTTLPKTPSVPTLSAVPGNGKVSLTWKAGSAGGSASSWNVYRSTSATTASKIVTKANLLTKTKLGSSARSYTNTPATNGTTYHYAVVASNSGGSATSNVVTAKPQVPAPGPATVTITGGNDKVDLAWAPTGQAVTSWAVYRSTGSTAVSTSGTPLATLAANVLAYTDNVVDNGTTYNYVVVGTNAGGAGKSSTATAVPLPPAPGAPVVSPTVTDGSVTLTWTSSGSPAATGFKVYRSATTPVSTAGTALASVDAASPHTYTDSTVTNGQTYYYVVTAERTAGPGTPSAPVTAHPVVAPPSAPTVTASAGVDADALYIDVDWTKAVTGGAVSSWKVYRSLTSSVSTSGTPLTEITDPTVTLFRDSTVAPSTKYYYVVVAVNATNTATSVSTNATTGPAVPAVPTLTATAGDAKVTLNWTAGSGGGAPTSWKLYRSTTSPVSTAGTALYTATAGTLTYSDDSRTNGTTYYYVVTAINASGTKASAEKSATPQLAAPSAPTLTASAGNATVGLSWTPGAGGGAVSGYTIYKSTISPVSTSGSSLTSVGSGTSTYTDNAVSNGTTYYYKVTADNATSSASSTEKSATPQLSAPSAPTLSASAGNATVGLSWTPGAGGGAVSGYTIYKSTTSPVSTSGSSLTSVGSGTTTYTDNAVSNGTTYYYKVTADNATSSASSTEKSATPTAGGSANLVVSNPDALPGSSNFVMSRMGYSASTNSLFRTENPDDPATAAADDPGKLTWFRTHDTATVHVANTGTASTQITGLAISNTGWFTTTTAAPLTVPAGGSVDIPIKFIATGAGDGTYGPKILSGTLTISATGQTNKVAQLRGAWQPGASRNGGNGTSNFEPGLDMIVNDIFGWTTDIEDLYDFRRDHQNGDEVLSPFWKAANSAQPVGVTRIASYSGFGLTGFKWYPQTDATGCATPTEAGCHEVLSPFFPATQTDTTGTAAGSSLGQTLLPLQVGDTAQHTFSPGTAAFGLDLGIEGVPEFSDYNRNTDTSGDVSNGCSPASLCGKHVRFYPIKDAAGATVPNAYIVTFDILAANYDFNDNVYVMTNVTPAS